MQLNLHKVTGSFGLLSGPPKGVSMKNIAPLTQPLHLLCLMVFLNSCGGLGGRSNNGSEGSPPSAPSHPPSTETTEDAADQVMIQYRDLPPGETSVLAQNSGVLGKDSLSCQTNGYGLATYQSKKLGDQPVRVCCVNLSVVGRGDETSKFVTREGVGYKIKPALCDATILSGATSPLEQLTVDLSDQKLIVFSESGGLSKVTQLKMHGPTTIGHVLSLGLNGPLASLALKGKAQLSQLNFDQGGISYTWSSEQDSLELKNVSLKRGPLSLVDGTTGLSTKRSTAFENVSVSTSPGRSPVVLTNYPFDTSGISIIPHSSEPSHIVMKGLISAPSSVLAATYPVATSVSFASGSRLEVKANTVLWTVKNGSPYTSSSTMFQMSNSSEISLLGTSDQKIRVEPYQRLDGGQISYQYLTSMSGEKNVMSLSHVHLQSTVLFVSQGNEAKLGNVHAEIKAAASPGPMQSRSQTISGTRFISQNGGRVSLNAVVSLKRDGAHAMFSHVHCGTTTGLSHLHVDDKPAMSIPSVILVKEDNDTQVANRCSQFYHDSKKQVLHNPSVAVLDGGNFRASRNCYFKAVFRSGFDRPVMLDCASLGTPRFDDVTILGNDSVYWTGTVTTTNNALNGDLWNNSTKVDLKDPAGANLNWFPSGVKVKLVVPESPTNDGFVLDALPR